MWAVVFLENVPRALALGAHFLSLRSRNHRASSNVEEHFFVLFLCSQPESEVAQDGCTATSQE